MAKTALLAIVLLVPALLPGLPCKTAPLPGDRYYPLSQINRGNVQRLKEAWRFDAGETGGLDLLYMMSGSASFGRESGEEVVLNAGDVLTASQGLVGDPTGCSPNMRLVRFFIAGKAQRLRERTPEEILKVEALGARIITHREVRPDGDGRPINGLQ